MTQILMCKILTGLFTMGIVELSTNNQTFSTVCGIVTSLLYGNI